MTYIDFAELKAEISIENSFDRLSLNMKKRGEAYRGPCPICQSVGDAIRNCGLQDIC